MRRLLYGVFLPVSDAASTASNSCCTCCIMTFSPLLGYSCAQSSSCCGCKLLGKPSFFTKLLVAKLQDCCCVVAPQIFVTKLCCLSMHSIMVWHEPADDRITTVSNFAALLRFNVSYCVLNGACAVSCQLANQLQVKD